MNNREKVINSKLKNKIWEFCVKISESIWKVEAKFSIDMIFWLLSHWNILLSEIWRWLKENISIKQTEKRLSKNLFQFKKEYSHELRDMLLAEHRKHISNDTVLTLDWWDINKKWALRMENLKAIHDWSTWERSLWYWLNSIVATKILPNWSATNVPLNLKLYSTKAEHFESQNRESIKAIDEVIKIIWTIWIWVLDRWYDRAKNIIKHLLERKLTFIIRWIWTRNVIRIKNGRVVLMKTLADQMKTRKRITYFEYKQTKNHTKKKQKICARVWYEKITIPWVEGEITLCVLKKLNGQLSMMMLTNKEVNSNTDVVSVFSQYSSRWWVEDTYKYMKQEFHLEKIMLKKYNSLQNMMIFLLAAMSFVSEIKRSSCYLSGIFIEKAQALNSWKLQYIEHSIVAWMRVILALSSWGIREYLRKKIKKVDSWWNLQLFEELHNPRKILGKL